MDYWRSGTVKDLKNALESAVTVAEKDTIDIEHLTPQLRAHPPQTASTVEPVIVSTGSSERQQFIDALPSAGGNPRCAALMSGINRAAIWNKMIKYGTTLTREINR